MSWFKSILSPFKKKEEPESSSARKAKDQSPIPALPKELADSPEAKGMMALFYRKWKDPAFLKQLKTLAAHMAQDGVNIKDMGAVKAWLEKNREAVEAGKFNEPPSAGAKPETYVKTGPDIGRNDPCHCGSGKKFKKCHGAAAP
ncbi:MAG: SEC-C domain-containing protein [Elusimicrobia bacterium]|nr:SEC-C domain-containing protein [Elusimicrobiota bacterium]